ncbi:hypothetical protein OIU77_018220, partial [Salix suchowensis]
MYMYVYEKIGLYFTYLAVSDSRGKIGVCVSKPAAAAAREEVVVRRLSPLPQSPVPAAAAATKGHSGLLTNSKSGQLG